MNLDFLGNFVSPCSLMEGLPCFLAESWFCFWAILYLCELWSSAHCRDTQSVLICYFHPPWINIHEDLNVFIFSLLAHRWYSLFEQQKNDAKWWIISDCSILARTLPLQWLPVNYGGLCIRTSTLPLSSFSWLVVHTHTHQRKKLLECFKNVLVQSFYWVKLPIYTNILKVERPKYFCWTASLHFNLHIYV